MRQEVSTLSVEIRERVALSGCCTLGIGGEARYFSSVRDLSGLREVLDWSRDRGLQVLVIGEGSNMLFPDEGYDGLVIQIRIAGIVPHGEHVVVGAGENLPSLIRWLNARGLQGLERMYGIPGSVAGAVVGNAGAYGQEICETVEDVKVLEPGGSTRSLSRAEMAFSYRSSILKQQRELILLECRLRLLAGGRDLQVVSDEILRRRSEKYPVGLKCPGSFFKNVPVRELTSEQRKGVPESFIIHDKIPAGKLLQAVGANGARRGDAMVASYHGNLILNRGSATCADVLWLARKYAGRVDERFGIRLEPEIRIIKVAGKQE